MTSLIVVLQSISAFSACIAALFFWRFWRGSRDRLFLFFAASFCLLAVSWFALAIISPTDESRPYAYAVRLLAFLLMIAAMIDKNREP